MRLKLYVGLIIALLFACASRPAFTQSAPAATGPKAYSPLAIGAGFSGFNPDYGHGHLLGGTLWIDYFPENVPHILRGIGIEAEARDLNYGRSTTEPSDLRQDVGSGGVIYSLPRYRKIRPYGKFLIGFGNDDDLVPDSLTKRKHDTRTVTSLGGGLDYHLLRSIWLRVDYEYQMWPNLFKHANPAIPSGTMDPQGFTIGAMYHFHSR